MQTQLPLQDTRPRPSVHRSSTLRAAATDFIRTRVLHTNLDGYGPKDDEALVAGFSRSVDRWTSHDPRDLARMFSGAMNDDPTEEFMSLCEKFGWFLSTHQEQLEAEWVSSGGIVEPAADVARVSVSVADGIGQTTATGILVPQENYRRVGKALFMDDAARADATSDDGLVTRMRIVKWEDVQTVIPPTEEDRMVLAAHEAAKAAAKALQAERMKNREAGLRREALLQANMVSDEEGRRLFEALGLGDDNAAAAKAANAILLVLGQRLAT